MILLKNPFWFVSGLPKLRFIHTMADRDYNVSLRDAYD
jgi:hypothetical protein